MNRILGILLILSVLGLPKAQADEGMWIPLLLQKENITDMQAKGLKLSAEDIFSLNQTSLKDAIVMFGRGCTGELISSEGLLLTNHHCGYGQVQAHSSLEHDYLTNGFWAMSKEEELVNKGLTVTFLVSMADVTAEVLKDVSADLSEADRQKKIKENSDKLIAQATAGTHYQGVIRPFYYGNAYYLFVNEVFKDVRLVGAPPSAIGKFGGDTDNWMWPRHTGDFSLFRIYADKDGKPADYSPDNVPYHPKKFFQISTKGIQEGDFTMVYGYPGATQEYLPSCAVDQLVSVTNPNRIRVRDAILDIMEKEMNADPQVRIQYSSKNAGAANAWKKWIGENRGLKRMNAVEQKKKLEDQFYQWVTSTPGMREKYSLVLRNLQDLYKKMEPYQLGYDYFVEAGMSMEIVKSARIMSSLLQLKENATESAVRAEVDKARQAYAGFFKDYDMNTDRQIFEKVFLDLYPKYCPVEFQPSVLREIQANYYGNYQKYADKLYSKSIFASQLKVNEFLDDFTIKSIEKVKKDPGMVLFSSLMDNYSNTIVPELMKMQTSRDSLMRVWMQVQREMQPEKKFYPDANSTLRITYGVVKPYEPRDGVHYEPFTTLDGIIQKDNPAVYDYNVPEKLRELYRTKDFGPYAVNGKLPVSFIGTNHTTGGNSGSPVLNADGQLIGINFDRNWEGTMSDVMYDPDMCRNITLDIRYFLFVVDKFAGAGNLVREMEIVK